MVPPETSATTQPWWVQTAEKPLNVPAVGCVTTTFWSAKTFPPPTGMSEVFPSGVPPPEPPDPSEDEGVPESAGVPASEAAPDEGAPEAGASAADPESESDPHAVRTAASPAPPAAATTVRRVGGMEEPGKSAMSCILSAGGCRAAEFDRQAA
jgi:hypothetical protein